MHVHAVAIGVISMKCEHIWGVILFGTMSTFRIGLAMCPCSCSKLLSLVDLNKKIKKKYIKTIIGHAVKTLQPLFLK